MAGTAFSLLLYKEERMQEHFHFYAVQPGSAKCGFS
jgi:hypothetical protein